MAKFICEPKALIQKAQDRQRGSKISGRPGYRGMEEREDRPERCDTYNPTAAKRAPHLPGDHNQLYQVAISQSPLSPRPDGPEPLGG
jgi:hypothetical protein